MGIEGSLISLTEENCKMLIKLLNEKKGIKYTKTKFNEIFVVKTKSEKALIGAFVDGKINFSYLFDVEMEDNKLDFNDEDVDENLDKLVDVLTEEQINLLYEIKEIYSALQLKAILGNHSHICDAMVESFEEHHKQLKSFKYFIKTYYPNCYYDIFRNSRDGKRADTNVGYPQYVGGNLINGKKRVVNLLVSDRSREEFYKYIKKILSVTPENIQNIEDYEEQRKIILELIENNQFLIKQRSKANAVFPNKLYEKELRQILSVNAEKYNFLKDVDSEFGITNMEKIIQILNFRVPYFVGPIGKNPNGQQHGWAERISNLDYKPWTLSKIINFDNAEDSFIGRMTNKCTYLKDKDVLPKQSIIYSKFRVLNELNKLRINGNEISVSLKQQIFNDLFSQLPKISAKDLKNYFVSEGLFSAKDINNIEVSGIDREFANNYSSYVKLISHPLFGKEFVDNNLETFEKIIKYHTIISDKNRLDKRLRKEFSEEFSDEQFKFLKGLNYKDWGSLSYEFLVGLKFVNKETGEITTVLDEMWNTNQNLQQVLNNSNYTLSDILYQKNIKDIKTLMYEDVVSLYCSPAVKRGVWQTLKIIQEISSVMEGMPEKIFVEVTRDDDVKGDAGRKLSRKNSLENLYKSNDFKLTTFITANELADLLMELNKKENERALKSERLYLYFLQAGKCAYSGNKIDIKDIFNDKLYDVDHIIPQAMIKDDSINNKVLVRSELNSIKSDTYPLPYEFISKRQAFWKVLEENKLMTKEKYTRLIRTTPLSDAELGEFIARQLVETNQSIKAVIDLIKSSVDNPRKVVYSKASLVSEFRHTFDLLKCRDINDLHHAQDAYLNIVVGNIMNSRFTDDPRNFNKNNDANRKVTKNVKKLFEGTVYSSLTHKIVWDAKKDISHVKQVCERTSPIISRMSFSNMNGAFYKETIHKSKKNDIKTEASITLKGDENNPLNNTEKYGGYNDLNNAYFIVVDSNGKKGQTIRTIESVPILAVRQFIGKPDYDKNILEYVSKVNKLKDAKLVVNKINFQSTLQIGGGEYLLGGKTGDKYVLHNFNQMYFSSKEVKYIKSIIKYLQYIKNKTEHILQQDDNRIVVSPASKEGNSEQVITRDDNIKLYDKFIEKLKFNVYRNMQLNTTFLPKLIDKRETFLSLSVQDQILVLSEIIKRCSCGATLANLSKLGEGTALGMIRINKNITDKNIVLIQRSATGLFEKRIKL